MKRPESPLQKKSEAYSGRIIRLYRFLVETKREQIMSKQVYRSGTSIGANIAESRFAQSSSDFISKLSIALKEAGETQYWLDSIYSAGLIDSKGYEPMTTDNTELIKMLVSSIKTMKKKIGTI